MSKTIIGEALPNIPWQTKPKGCDEVVWRYENNPVVGRKAIKGTDKVYNSAVIPFEGEFVGIFRADHKTGYPNLHVGRSKNAIKWEIETGEIHFVNEDGSPAQPILYGYDPRVVCIEGIYYITWCNYFHGPTIGVARTTDFKQFILMENVYVPFNRNGVLFPRKINGSYALLNRPSDNGHTPFGDIFISYSPDMIHWGRHRHVMTSGELWWRNTKIGPGPVPIETTEGWLMIYHGVSNTCRGYNYNMGAALLDIDDPSKVLFDSKDFIMTAEEPYETSGFVPNVIFPCATLNDADTGRIALYYGSADTCCALAFTYVDELIDFIKNHAS